MKIRHMQWEPAMILLSSKVVSVTTLLFSPSPPPVLPTTETLYSVKGVRPLTCTASTSAPTGTIIGSSIDDITVYEKIATLRMNTHNYSVY